MSITSGFFDSVSGDRTYNAEQMSMYFDGLISDGVYESVANRFLVSSGTGMTVNVDSGRAVIQCHWIANDAVAVLSLDPADVQYSRIDAICLRLDRENRTISLTVKKGTPSANPVLPAITRTSSAYELYLASVSIPKGAAQPAAITDLRPSTYCGWVTGLIKQVDTSDLYQQWQLSYANQYAIFDLYMQMKMQEFNNWFAALTQQLTVNTTFTKYEHTHVLQPPDMPYAHIIIAVGIPEYDPNTDALMVFANGSFWTEGRDYDQISDPDLGASIEYKGKPFKPTSQFPITFVVFKNVIGGNVLAPAGIAEVQAIGASNYTAGIAETVEEVS